MDVIKVMASGGMLTQGTGRVRRAVLPRRSFGRCVDRPLTAPDCEVLAHAHSLAGIQSCGRGRVWTGSSTSPASPTAGTDDARRGDRAGRGGRHPGAPHAGVHTWPGPAAASTWRPASGCPRSGWVWTSRPCTRPGSADFARLRSDGVRVVSGTDAGIGPPKAHGGVGLRCSTWWPPAYTLAEALATATSGAADSCGLGDVTGRLAPGSPPTSSSWTAT